MEFNYSKNNEGVSPVIGVILMVAITVILAAVIGLFVIQPAGNLDEDASESVTVTIDDGEIMWINGETDDRILVYVNGEKKEELTGVGDSYTVNSSGSINIYQVDGENRKLINMDKEGITLSFEFTSPSLILSQTADDIEPDTYSNGKNLVYAEPDYNSDYYFVALVAQPSDNYYYNEPKLFSIDTNTGNVVDSIEIDDDSSAYSGYSSLEYLESSDKIAFTWSDGGGGRAYNINSDGTFGSSESWGASDYVEGEDSSDGWSYWADEETFGTTSYNEYTADLIASNGTDTYTRSVYSSSSYGDYIYDINPSKEQVFIIFGGGDPIRAYSQDIQTENWTSNVNAYNLALNENDNELYAFDSGKLTILNTSDGTTKTTINSSEITTDKSEYIKNDYLINGDKLIKIKEDGSINVVAEYDESNRPDYMSYDHSTHEAVLIYNDKVIVWDVGLEQNKK